MAEETQHEAIGHAGALSSAERCRPDDRGRQKDDPDTQAPHG